jgi:hypothetical protein
LDIAAGRRRTEMTILSTASLMDKYNNNQGKESSREGISSCHCVCEREKGDRISFFLRVYLSQLRTIKVVNLKLKTKMPGTAGWK